MNDRRIRALTLVSLAAVAVYCFAQLELTGSIIHFIPTRAQAELVALSLELVDSPLNRRMILSIEGGPQRTRVAAELASSLRAHPEVTWVETGLDEADLRSLYDLYFERRIYLAALHPEIEIPELTSRQALDAQAERLRARLAGPDAMLLTRSAPRDPLGLFERIIGRIRALAPQGQAAATGDERGWSIVQLGLRSSAFDPVEQVDLLHFIESEFARLAALHGGGLVLEQSGVNRFAVASERSVRGDLNFISVVSISVVCGLFLVIFRSFRNLLIAVITPAGGFAFALAVTLATSKSVHGITLAFGFVLIGVAIDYPIHLMNHHALAGGKATPRDSLAGIRSSLLLSGATTTLAFLSLSLSEFPGLGGMGTFAAIGVAVSLLLTVFALPSFLRDRPGSTTGQRALAAGFVRLVRAIERRPGTIWLGLIGCALISLAGLPRLHWKDDPADLMTMDPALLAEASRVQARVGEFDGGRFVVGIAPDVESALVLNEQIQDRLEPLVGSGEIEAVGSLRTFVLSESLQRRNLAALRAVPDLGAKIDAAFTRNGFRPGAFADFGAAVADPGADPLRPQDLVGTPFERVLAALVEIDRGLAVVTLVRGVQSGDAIRAALGDLDGAYYVDQGEIMADVYEGYRRSTVRMLGLGAGVVLVLLQLRYRRPVRGLLAFLPAGLGASTTLGLFGLFGVPVNVVSAISLLVVLGMGVDYGIFAVDAADEVDRQGATLSSLLVSCLTSVFVFGVLALSAQPVLRAIGLTTGVGILLALAISPGTLALARRT